MYQHLQMAMVSGGPSHVGPNNMPVSDSDIDEHNLRYNNIFKGAIPYGDYYLQQHLMQQQVKNLSKKL